MPQDSDSISKAMDEEELASRQRRAANGLPYLTIKKQAVSGLILKLTGFSHHEPGYCKAKGEVFYIPDEKNDPEVKKILPEGVHIQVTTYLPKDTLENHILLGDTLTFPEITVTTSDGRITFCRDKRTKDEIPGTPEYNARLSGITFSSNQGGPSGS